AGDGVGESHAGNNRFDESSKKPVFPIDTPPPTVSGRMHLGHAFSYTQADAVARFKRMQGFGVFYPFGFDDNGLATERMVEKNRKIQAKNFSRKDFVQICLDETRGTEKLLENDFRAIGLSVDWSRLYRTISRESQRTAQLSFIEIFESGRAYRKEAPTMWCPRCETAIAQAELEDEEKNSKLFFASLDIEGGGQVVIATTRPEMMPACVGVHVNPADKRYKGLIGKNVALPFSGRKVPVIANPDVKIDFGTGAVYHCTFGGQQDVEWALAYQTPVIEIIDRNGRLNEKAGQLAGMNVPDARKKIALELAKLGRLQKTLDIVNVTNVHERCKTPVEILTSRQWFVRYLDLKERFIEQARKINWAPPHMRFRMENWVNGLKWDWNISRQRYFGVAFPVWYCKKCGETILAERKSLPVDPLKDSPGKKCGCGSTEFEGEKDVFDTWFTSSMTPQIALKWREDEKFFKKNFPMGLRVQAHDIINLWAFYTIVKAFLHGKNVPWKNIMISGHALDPAGRKMSKSLGNAIEPLAMIEKYSADMLRYWALSATLGDDLAFQEKDLVAGRKFLTKLSNAARFVSESGKGITLPKDFGKAKLRANDKWILSRLNETIAEATKNLEEFEFSKALVATRNFFWLEFADHYLEQVKYRVYGPDEESKKAALLVLDTVMFDVLGLLSPFIPHTTEEIAQTHFREKLSAKSIHLKPWPRERKEIQDEKAMRVGSLLALIVSAVRKEKTSRQSAMNSEMKKITVFGPPELEGVLEEIKHAMNAKEVVLAKGKGSIGVAEGVSLEIGF
ncbi:MAG: valine--tRNA ligase, partial [Candidatus Diapherotrites archaeon]|nr:valine--tRNA ligase [Candidatus Diapherotrites archaeon]